jgi:hypothetical protein
VIDRFSRVARLKNKINKGLPRRVEKGERRARRTIGMWVGWKGAGYVDSVTDL